MTGLRLGAFLTTRRDANSDEAVFDQALEMALHADRLGYDSVWVNEHHFIDYGRCPAPLTMAAFILGKVGRIRVGTAVVLLALHNPLDVAEQVAVIDQLSGGRLDLGLGKGGYTRDLAAFGVLPAELDHRWRANLDTVTEIFDGGRVTSSGSVSWQPALPLAPAVGPDRRHGRYIATATPATIEWAAQHGYGLLIPYHLDLDGKVELVRRYERFADRHGVDAGEVSHVVTAVAQVADTRKDALAAIRQAHRRWLEGGSTDLGHDTLRRMAAYRAMLDIELGRHKPPKENIDHLMHAGPVGTVSDCVAWLDELVARTGVRRTALFLDVSANAQVTRENMAGFAEEIRPQLAR